MARGRVWTGLQAKERGLVDVLGGLDEAIKQAKEAAKLPADKSVVLRAFPRPKSTFEKLMAGFDGTPDQGAQSRLLQRLSVLEPVLHRLDQLSQAARGGAAMPPIDIAD